MDNETAAHIFYAEQLLRSLAQEPRRAAAFLIAAAALTSVLQRPGPEGVAYPELRAKFLEAADSLRAQQATLR